MSANTLSINMPMNNASPKGRVLCVDDEPNILRALSWLLNKEFQVVTALNAQEGLALIRGGDFDVVLSDQRMPDMSGVDFLNEVRRLAPRAMRILLTGYSDMQAVLRSVNESEIFRYVNKPWDVTELPAIVAEAAAVARRQEARPASAPQPAAAAPIKLLVLDDDEATHAAVEMSAGDLAEIIHATSPVDALQILEREDIGVILAERMLGGMDLTHLLCLLKRQHPQIVSLVLTETMDSHLIARLINQGQIHRFIPKPAKAGCLRQALKSALERRAELLADPQLGERYQPEATAPADEPSVPADAVPPLPGTGEPHDPGRFGRFGGLVRRLLGE